MKTISLERTIVSGTKFVANSKGIPALWTVSRRVKTNKANVIWCKVVDGIGQARKYTGKQFGMLLRLGVIRLV